MDTGMDLGVPLPPVELPKKEQFMIPLCIRILTVICVDVFSRLYLY